MKYYPAFLNLKDKKAVVIGGGRVAERKVRTLIQAGASVTVISPALTANLKRLLDKKQIEYIKKNYEKGDVKNAFMVIAATSFAQINTQAAHDAKFLINVVDTPAEGNFIAPSIVKRGPLTIAISTEGSSPALSKSIRKELEKLYGKEFELYLKFVGSLRRKTLKHTKDPKKRERFLKSLASEKIFDTLRNKGFSAASKKIHALKILFDK